MDVKNKLEGKKEKQISHSTMALIIIKRRQKLLLLLFSNGVEKGKIKAGTV